MTPPRVSIVTATLNRRPFLEKALESVASQTYTPVEHVVVDGGSTDGTVELLREASKTLSLRWVSEPDGGMYHAINKGMAMATGDVLGYLNSDDQYFPWSVAAAVAALLQHPEIDVVYGDLAYLDTSTGTGGLRLYPPFRLGYLIRSAFIGQPTAFFRRHVFVEMDGFDERLQFVADCDFWMRAGRKFRFYKLDEVLAIDGVHGGTLRVLHSAALRDELRQVRHKNGSERGWRGLAQRFRDIAYYVTHTEAAFGALLFEWLRHRFLSRPPRRWAAFLTSDAEISGLRLLLCLIPDRRRRLGRGVIKWQRAASGQPESHA